MTPRKLSVITGLSYLVIFFAAIFANFFVLEALKTAPVETISQNHTMVRWGIVAFLITVVFDVVVAWGLFEMYPKNILSRLSTYFRLMHAAIFGLAIFALVLSLDLGSADAILLKVDTFNIIWLIGLFFFGIHLVLLARILGKPRLIAFFLIVAGIMYMLDTVAHFVLPNYDNYADIFLAMVAVPSIGGEMAFSIWLLVKGGKKV